MTDIRSSVSSGGVLPPFDGFDEYKAIVEHVDRMSSRRQTAHNFFIGLHTVFMAGLGALLVSGGFSSWLTVGEVFGITLALLPLNLLWRSTLRRYQGGLRLR